MSGLPATATARASPAADALQPGGAGVREVSLTRDLAPKWDGRPAVLPGATPLSPEHHDGPGGEAETEPCEPSHEEVPDQAGIGDALLPALLALPTMLATLLPTLLAPLLQSIGRATPGVGGTSGDPRGGNGFAPGDTSGDAAGADQPTGGYGPVAATPQAVLDFLQWVRDQLFGDGANANGVGSNGLGAPVYGSGGHGETLDRHRDAARLAANAEEAIENLKRQLRSAIERYVGSHETNRDQIDALIRDVESALQQANRIPNRAARENRIREIMQDALRDAQQIIGDEQTNTTRTATEINRLTNQMTDKYLADLRRLPPGRLRDWIEQARNILRRNGIRDDQMDPADIARIIQRESSGRPSLVNNWDINARRGDPSFGLMQTTGHNFDRYALPGYTDRTNPVHQIIAGVRYSTNEYPQPGRRVIGGTGRFDGSVSYVPGIISLNSGRGYRPY